MISFVDEVGCDFGVWGLYRFMPQRARLEGRLNLIGLQRPVVPEIYNMALEEMKAVNVHFVEKVFKCSFFE